VEKMQKKEKSCLWGKKYSPEGRNFSTGEKVGLQNEFLKETTYVGISKSTQVTLRLFPTIFQS
jgi:hypothetical protein